MAQGRNRVQVEFSLIVDLNRLAIEVRVKNRVFGFRNTASQTNLRRAKVPRPSVVLVDNTRFCLILSIMPKAALLIDERVVLAPNMFAELVVWQVPRPVRGSEHLFKYRLALLIDGECVLRYDNEAGKGDHRHEERTQELYVFSGVEALREAFMADVEAILERRA
jgi:hypothetical protein